MESKHKKKAKKEDFYEVLEVERSATQEQIKSSYRKLALVSNTSDDTLAIEKPPRQESKLGRVE